MMWVCRTNLAIKQFRPGGRTGNVRGDSKALIALLPPGEDFTIEVDVGPSIPASFDFCFRFRWAI
jgi:hypothetical protein